MTGHPPSACPWPAPASPVPGSTGPWPPPGWSGPAPAMSPVQVRQFLDRAAPVSYPLAAVPSGSVHRRPDRDEVPVGPVSVLLVVLLAFTLGAGVTGNLPTGQANAAGSAAAHAAPRGRADVTPAHQDGPGTAVHPGGGQDDQADPVTGQ